MVEPVGALLDAFEQLGLVLLGPGDVVGAQGGDGRLDAREGRAQVVADGGQQRRADPVALGQLLGLVGLALEALAVEYDGGLGGEGGEDPAVLGGQHPAGQRECHVVADRHVDVRVLGPHGCHSHAHLARAGPRLDVALPFQQHRRVHAEGLADPLQQLRQTGLAAQHVPGEEGQDLRLGAQPGRLVGAAGREVDHGGDGHRHEDEDHQREQVLRVGDRDAAQGRGEEPVQQQ